MTGLNVDNRTIFCRDNLDILRGINSNCIDLIYLDPPFNKNKRFTAPVGSSAKGAHFDDIFREEDVKDEWLQTIKEDHLDLYTYLEAVKIVGRPYNFAYLAYMGIRLLECHRVLKPTGSIYLHCDPTMSHYLKTTMDCIFGEHCFKNEIIWKRTNAPTASVYHLGQVHDTILAYAKNSETTMNAVFAPYTEEYVRKHFRKRDGRGNFHLQPLTAQGTSGGYSGLPWRGVNPSEKGLHWVCPTQLPDGLEYPDDWSAKTTQERLEWLHSHDMIYFPERGKVPRFKRYLSTTNGVRVADVMTDIPGVQGSSEERTGYPTQKPLALLERIIKASSNEGDMVLDPFCGCATTCVAAERLGRKWIGIDVSIEAHELVKKRLKKEAAPDDDLLRYQNKIIFKIEPPKRTDQGEGHREQKWVYVISNPSYPGEYKVGIARDPKARLNQYQTSDPDRAYVMEFKHQTPDFRKIETHIHDKFDNKREWVTGNLADIVEAIKTFKQP